MPLGDNEAYNEAALQVYRDALPGYTVHGLEGFPQSTMPDDCFLNTDALHCRTHEVPDKNMLFIDSREVYNGTVELQDEYLVKTNIVSYAKADIKDVKIHYSINDGAYVESDMTRYNDTTNFIFNFTNLKSGDDVKYYITATDNSLNYNIDPTCGDKDPHHFTIE